ncbi:putative N(4)-(beta-N-acetylglucosaminyl)-L-asparaginase GM21137 isoform X2 [Tribolium madens]|uniref:putative N(4)-(beta-N-acetylglucosaminyl)-L-asparaginase GM21137 isoform X2 n=1 Tax=Tribolium madens TaxID=41895 RepID=UPI001CF73947|nr:putative N(4)-(beta-N-acetylglucosaminyl)-L-asparaginase GM21137 isoform X2 [Tribolium madens]
MSLKPFIHLIVYLIFFNYTYASVPVVMNTWRFSQAAVNAFLTLKDADSDAIDAVVTGCSTCEGLQCDHSVGYGGSPDENGETTLDAMIFDGTAMNMGAVGGLRRIKDAALAAKMVLQHTKHSFLVGDLATEFAKNFELHEENLSTNYSTNLWKEWKSKNCQPNFWQNVDPDPTKTCGPYEASDSNEVLKDSWKIFNSDNHDTIGMIAIDERGNVAAGTSTNGANHKIPGRVGDSPIPGAGAYADSTVGAAVATGDGDVMMRFSPRGDETRRITYESSPDCN